MVDFDADLGIVTEAWSPLGRGSDVIGDPVIAAIASAHRRTPAQVVLRWHVQRGVVPIPKSSNPSRMAENLAVFDLELSSAEMARIAALNGGRRLGGDPDRHAEL